MKNTLAKAKQFIEKNPAEILFTTTAVVALIATYYIGKNNGMVNLRLNLYTADKQLIDTHQFQA